MIDCHWLIGTHGLLVTDYGYGQLLPGNVEIRGFGISGMNLLMWLTSLTHPTGVYVKCVGGQGAKLLARPKREQGRSHGKISSIDRMLHPRVRMGAWEERNPRHRGRVQWERKQERKQLTPPDGQCSTASSSGSKFNPISGGSVHQFKLLTVQVTLPSRRGGAYLKPYNSQLELTVFTVSKLPFWTPFFLMDWIPEYYQLASLAFWIE